MAKSIAIIVSGNAAPLRKALGDAGDQLSNFGNSVKKFALPAAAALGAVAFAGFDAAKAAMEDESAAKLLERQLKATTKATDKQVAATESWILKQSLATGQSDSELRPALGKLIRSTKDLTKSQELLQLAQDISIQTGKPLAQVSDALGKAYNKQYGPLSKLDPTLKAVVKSGASAETVFGKLNDTFGGASAEFAKTYEGQLRRVQVAMDESKETIGQALLPALGSVLEFVNAKLVPGLATFGEKIQKDGFVSAIGDMIRAGWDWLANTGLPMLRDKLAELGGAFIDWIGPRIGPMLSKLGELIAAGADWILNTGLPAWVDKLKGWGDAFVAWIGPNIAPMLSKLGELIGKLGVWALTEALPKLLRIAAEWSGALIGWAFELAPQIIKGLGQMVWEMIKKVPELAQKLGAAFLDLGKAIGTGLVNGVIGLVNILIRKLNDLLEFTIPVPFGPDIRVNAPDLPEIPKLADGGLVMGPTTALVGEAGPELVVPLDKLSKMSGNTYQISVQTGVGDPREIGRQVVEAIKQYERTAGPVFQAA